MYDGKVPIPSGFLCWATYSEWAQWGPGPSSRGRFVKGWVDQPIITDKCWATHSEWAQWGPGPSSRGRFV